MKRFHIYAVLLITVGTFWIDINLAQAEKASAKEKDNPALVTKKADKQPNKVEKSDKKPGCRPGSMMTMGVGC
jgi:hypothetical protein